MTYEIGDPNHIEVHDALVADVQAQADRFSVDVILPDHANLGDLGHTSDHNLIVTALQAIADAPAGGISWAVVTGGTVTEYTHPEYGVMEVHKFTAAGTLTVDTPGFARVLIVGGGMAGNGSSGQAAGSGGGAHDSYQELTAGAIAVTVGAAAGWNANAGQSSLGALSIGGAITSGLTAPKRGGGGLAISAGGFAGGGAMGDGNATTGGLGLTSDITGASVIYGKGGNKTGTTSAPANTGGGGDGGGSGAAGVVIVAVKKPVA